MRLGLLLALGSMLSSGLLAGTTRAAEAPNPAGEPPAATPAVNPAKVFTPRQRAAIVAIMRQALQEDPTILSDAVQFYRDKALQRQQAATVQGAHAVWNQLTAAPAFAVRGNPQGRLTVVEFLDPRCTYCRHMSPLVTDFLKRHPDVRLVEKVVPVLGPASLTASRAIFAAAQQGKYAEMRDALLLSPAQPDEGRLKKLARSMDLDMERFFKDMTGPVVNGLIAQNLGQAQKVNMEGTPTFLFGPDTVVPGAASAGQLDAALESAKQAGTRP
ncbi:DsbA family protein [Oecophyllibacter saccharovorans]|uniref:DsbA family protein n=1 Tax=Oecophyllibacter saccharovorans TaxID=2558360 RepID=UPI001144F71B|nr:DsbA family protein [Oecophyllibacter saccharovorans]QDH15012.1 DsbA family protein [Oecophyllibacter saccharovorans]